MPYRWVPPEVFLEHKGITVYHVYTDDDIESPSPDWYMIGTDDTQVFSVKKLSHLAGLHLKQDHAPIIKQAIDRGLLPDQIRLYQ